MQSCSRKIPWWPGGPTKESGQRRLFIYFPPFYSSGFWTKNYPEGSNLKIQPQLSRGRWRTERRLNDQNKHIGFSVMITAQKKKKKKHVPSEGCWCTNRIQPTWLTTYPQYHIRKLKVLQFEMLSWISIHISRPVKGVKRELLWQHLIAVVLQTLVVRRKEANHHESSTIRSVLYVLWKR